VHFPVLRNLPLDPFKTYNWNSSVFCGFTRCKEVLNRRLGTACLSHLQRSSCRYPWRAWPLEMGSTGSSETSVSNHLTPRNNPEDGRIQYYRDGSLWSRMYNLCLKRFWKLAKECAFYQWIWRDRRHQRYFCDLYAIVVWVKEYCLSWVDNAPKACLNGFLTAKVLYLVINRREDCCRKYKTRPRIDGCSV
jgi:hypothetical protein